MSRSDAIVWMKGVGMTLIVYGHVAHASTVPWTPPIYPKQLGVALFLFATGFTLAREHRRAAEVVFMRLFPVYLFGLAAAAAITIVGWATQSGLALSNYGPFAGGLHVLFDNFPANPTTWYLGTYVHMLALWALWLRRREIGRATIAMAVALEIPIRAVLILLAGPFIAYMLASNWLSVFVLGLALGARPDTEPRGSAALRAAALIAGVAIWAVIVGSFGFTPNFPFMTIDRWPAPAATAMVSLATSMLYLGVTRLAFEAARRADAPAAVRFIARNSLIIVLGHMPLFLALNPVLAAVGFGYWLRVGVHLLLCLPGLALLSELITVLVGPKRLAATTYHLLAEMFASRMRPTQPVPSGGNR